MTRFQVGVFFVGVSCAMLGCGGQTKFPVAPASGRVVCEGEPVPHVIVFFEPINKPGEKLKNVTGKPGIGFADEQGRFTIHTYGDNDGAVIGRHRVRVDFPPPEFASGFKCACVLSSNVDAAEVDVVSGQPNLFDIQLKKATPKEAKVMDSTLKTLAEEAAADAGAPTNK